MKTPSEKLDAIVIRPLGPMPDLGPPTAEDVAAMRRVRDEMIARPPYDYPFFTTEEELAWVRDVLGC